MSECRIVFVGKNRNGSARYWCMEHHAPAWGKGGLQLSECLALSKAGPWDRLRVNLDSKEELRQLLLRAYLPPAYDTASPVSEISPAGGPAFSGEISREDFPEYDGQEHLVPRAEELAVVSQVASHTFGYETVYLECPHCGEAHLDVDWFAVNPHKVHLCLACGRSFRVKEANIGNPLSPGKAVWEEIRRQKVSFSGDRLEIRQKDFPGGITVGAAINTFYGNTLKTEAGGVLIRAFGADSRRPATEGIYAHVTIDGVPIDGGWARLYMVQQTLPFLRGRILALRCPDCGEPLLDAGESSQENGGARACPGEKAGYMPDSLHRCKRCGKVFGTRRRVVSNPFVETIQRLQEVTGLPLREKRGWEVFGKYPASSPFVSSPQNSCSQE